MGQGQLILGLALAAGIAHGALVEETSKTPVEVAMADGTTLKHEIIVTVFRDDARARAPFVILNHGRAPTAQGRAELGRARYSAVSRYLVEKGFTVFVPTRLGYGDTGGADIEFPFGRCDQWEYAATFEAAAVQTLAIVEYARAKTYVDRSRGLLLGQSQGGSATIAAAAKSPVGIVAGINFAGGGGGDPKGRPGRPCGGDNLKAFFTEMGRQSKLPTLWLYSENDQFWGPDLPLDWYKSYVAAGGKARFVRLPAHGDNGHDSFTSNIDAWKPAFEEFLKSLGFN